MSYPGIALKKKLPTKRAFPLVEKWFLRHIFNAIGLAPVGLQFKKR